MVNRAFAPLFTPRLLDYLRLCRVSNLPTVWTNVLAAVVLSGAGLSLVRWAALFLALSCLYAAGTCLNDLWDLERDRLAKPSRPLPSGRVAVGEAWALVLALFGLGLALLRAQPHAGAFRAGLVLAAAIVAYDRLHKSHAWSVYLMAGCRFLVFAVSAMAASGSLGLYPALAGLAQFGYVVALSRVARREHARGRPFAHPVIPAMIAGISLVDGAVLALLTRPGWFFAGLLGAALTAGGQRYVKGD